MKQYDSYKDSGIEWIGKIPSHWGVYRIRYNYYLKGRIGWQGLKADEFIDEGPYLITGTDFIKGKVNWDTCYHISKERYDEAPEIHVKEGDLLITKDGTVGKTAYIDRIQGPSSLNSHLLIIRPFNGRCNNLFLQYVINSKVFDSFMWIFQTGSIMASISQEKFSDFRFPLPSKEEQLHIISYLDKKCGEIDKAIATQQKRIDLLGELRQNIITHAVTRGINPDAPLKDSGVEWIGKVPEHWEIKRIKHCASIFGRIGFRGYTTQDLVEEGEGPITLSPSNMKGNMDYSACTYLSWFKYNESPEIQIHNGDVLFVKTGSTYGKTAYVDHLPMEATINPQIVVFKDFNECNSKYFYYLLTTDIVQSQVNNTVIGSTIPTIGQEKIRNYVISMPPLDEQQEIVAHVEKKTASIDKSIAKANRQIDLLQELKQSIITEVVTGKRKVVA